MPDVKRTIKIITEQKAIPGADSGVAGFPLRHWTMKIVLLHAETKQEIDATCFSQATYHLHESFGDRAKQVLKNPPFRVAEDGWGEFELKIDLQDVQGKTHEFLHDLNFQNPRYEVKHVITFKSPKPLLLAALRDSGPVPGETNGAVDKKRASDIGVAGEKPKKKKGGESSKAFDMDKLAEGLQKLNEDDLLQVVQMVHDHKSDESWMRNDIEQGEFHVDLYTLPDSLIKMLWDFTTEKVQVSGAA
ncbi:transcription factor TFIIF complex subunit Tfg3 [Exophiala xenobiotica]|uniref:Transcription factor TFIIF complex subunit Tfg3 n=1 Tax=Lithohypha guttulata TaxID=1690604 RepID=A0ABR0JU67_9EURO|nr:transcription factor TFIIF complex subunit Tfg3 [Lithohypha guttulata]KAK5309348.1 transcription factor TFIIF complex subunit Tfg3 [Exophiala xenobiotica]